MIELVFIGTKTIFERLILNVKRKQLNTMKAAGKRIRLSLL